MEIYRIENLSFTYPQRKKEALSEINFSVKSGEFITICGKSGCGKTTLLKMLKTAMSPFGTVKGNIYFKNRFLKEIKNREQSAEIGFITQNPDSQIVTDKVWHELAFGLESLGYKNTEIRTRVAEMASFFGIENWFHKKVTELSGGQKQLLNLSSVMVIRPSVLILDEPVSQLDPIAAEEFIRTLEKINRELGTTVIITEHRLEEVFSISDRVIVMDDGKIIADESPKKVGEILKNSDNDMYTALPVPMRVWGAVDNSLECPLSVRDGRNWLLKYSEENSLNPDAIPKDTKTADNDILIELKDVWFRYKKDLPDVIKGLNFSIMSGEIFALTGGNGTGKTTALSLISGLNKPYRGEIIIKGKKISQFKNLYDFLGVLPQNPQALFVEKTVYLDLLEILPKNISDEEKNDRIAEIALLCRIDDLLFSHPYDLSGGEQQRAALAKVLLREPEILLLDEPTKGMDADFKECFSDILSDLKAKGVTVVMVTHDIEFSAENADRCAMFFDGGIAGIDTPREFFSKKSFYTTAACRMAGTILPNAILTNDIIAACGGNINKKEKTVKKKSALQMLYEKQPKKLFNKELYLKSDGNKNRLTKRILAVITANLLIAFFTVLAGTYFLDNKKYYFISLMIILETIVPFFTAFESRKPKAREIIVISVLCALAVAGRSAFFMIPQFKPVTAVVIISGICFGGEAGFLVGAVTAFVSNFFFGQGPWTPWQMFSFGITGFISGVFFRMGLIGKSRISLCIFGFLATLIIYGGIMNPASVIVWQPKPTFEMILAAYAAGFPFDLIHAFSTAFFLWFISVPMIEKLERVKVKYGIIDR